MVTSIILLHFGYKTPPNEVSDKVQSLENQLYFQNKQKFIQAHVYCKRTLLPLSHSFLS